MEPSRWKNQKEKLRDIIQGVIFGTILSFHRIYKPVEFTTKQI